jgi:hypothetical protein
MTLIEWMVTIELVVCVGFIVWLLKKALWHVRQNPAEAALQKHLIELETKTSRNSKKEELK